MTVFKCICKHEYMYVCMYVCMYVLSAYIHVRVCMHLCVYVIFKLGFERYGGNCPSWEGELSGGIVRGEVSGRIVRGKCPFPKHYSASCSSSILMTSFKMSYCLLVIVFADDTNVFF